MSSDSEVAETLLEGRVGLFEVVLGDRIVFLSRRRRSVSTVRLRERCETHEATDVELVSSGREVLGRKKSSGGSEERRDEGRDLGENESKLTSGRLVCLRGRRDRCQ